MDRKDVLEVILAGVGSEFGRLVELFRGADVRTFLGLDWPRVQPGGFLWHDGCVVTCVLSSIGKLTAFQTDSGT